MFTIDMRDPSGAEDTAIGLLMYDAIHRGASQYTAAQRRIWLPRPNEGREWTERLSAQCVVVARVDADLVGVMTLVNSYIDLAFVAAAFQGQGVFRALYTRIENEARALERERLHTHASLMAQPAFLAMGFRVTQHENAERDGQGLRGAEMEKRLT